MYQKFLFIYSRKELRENYKLIKEEISKSFKFYVNFIEENKLHGIEMDSDEIITRNDIRTVQKNNYVLAFTFIYKEKQEPSKLENWKSKTAEEYLEDIVSIFDKRKINKCFNYKISSFKEEDILENIISNLTKNYNYEEKSKIRRLLKLTIDIDKKMYKGHKYENLLLVKELKKELNVFFANDKNIKKIISEKKLENKDIKSIINEVNFGNEIIKIGLSKLFFKYDLIKIYDFSLIKEIIVKELKVRYLDIVLNKKQLENLILDETYESIFLIVENCFSRYLKNLFGKGFVKTKITTFFKYIEENNLQEMLIRTKHKIRNKLFIGYNYSSWMKKKNIFLDRRNRLNGLIRAMIQQKRKTIRRYSDDLIEFFIDVSKKSNSRKGVNINNEILKIFYFDRIETFFLLCKEELNANEKSKLSKEKRRDENINDTLKKEYINIFQSIWDIIEKDKELYNDIYSENIFPNEIFGVLKEYEQKILNILQNVDDTYDNNNKKIKYIQKEIKDRISKLLDNNTIKIDFDYILNVCFDLENVINEIFSRYIEYENVRIKKEIMSEDIKNRKENELKEEENKKNLIENKIKEKYRNKNN